jgi:hypothetical protein
MPFLMKRLIAIAANLPSKDPDGRATGRPAVFAILCVAFARTPLARLTPRAGAPPRWPRPSSRSSRTSLERRLHQMRARPAETNDPRADSPRNRKFRSPRLVPFNTGLSK